MSAAEALRRCPTAVFLRPRHALYRQYSRVVWDTVGEIVPRVERTGIDEGYLDLGTVARDFTRARAVASAIQTAVRAQDEPHVLARGRRPRRSCARSRPTGASPAASRVVPPGTEARFLAPLAVRLLPGVGPRAEERLRRRRRRHDRRARRARRRRAALAPPGHASARCCATARSGVDPRDLDLELEPVSVSAEDTFPRDLDGSRAAARRGAAARRARLRAPAQLRPVRPDGDREAPLRATSRSARARRRCPRQSTRPSSSARSPAASSTAGFATVPARFGSSVSASPGLSPVPPADARGVVESADARGGVLGARHRRLALGRRRARATLRPSHRLIGLAMAFGVGRAHRGSRVRARARRLRDRSSSWRLLGFAVRRARRSTSATGSSTAWRRAARA